MVKFPQFVLKRLSLRQGQSVDHPDADTLTSFGERRLNNRERREILAHLAQCPECRDVLALCSMAQPSEQVYSAWPERIHNRGWQHLRWAVPVAVACLLIGIVRFPPQVSKPAPQLTAPVSQTDSQPVAVAHNIPEPAKAPAAAQAPKIRRRLRELHLPPKATESVAAPVEPLAPAPPPNIIEPAMEAKTAATSLPIEEPAITTDRFLSRQTVPPEAANPAPTEKMRFEAMSKVFLPRIQSVPREKSLWSLDASSRDAAGARAAIQKSSDGGKTWQTIHVSNHARLYALSANGPNVWVGGARGALFHSADDGLHWTPVIVEDRDGRLSESIIGIEDFGGNTIRLKVQSAAGWVTNDRGLHWRRE